VQIASCKQRVYTSDNASKVAYAVKQVRVGRWPNQYNALCTNVKKINMRVGWTIRSTKTESSAQRINSRATNACLLQWEKQYCKLGFHQP
jgi:hypothetical protein